MASTGRFELEDAVVEFGRIASVEQKLMERFDPGERRHAFYIDINLGPEGLPRPLAEYAKEIGSINVLAKDEAGAVDQEEVATQPNLIGLCRAWLAVTLTATYRHRSLPP